MATDLEQQLAATRRELNELDRKIVGHNSSGYKRKSFTSDNSSGRRADAAIEERDARPSGDKWEHDMFGPGRRRGPPRPSSRSQSLREDLRDRLDRRPRENGRDDMEHDLPAVRSEVVSHSVRRPPAERRESDMKRQKSQENSDSVPSTEDGSTPTTTETRVVSEQEKKRHQRFFGLITGTLNQFQKELSSSSDVAKKRESVVIKVEEEQDRLRTQALEEVDRLKRQRQEKIKELKQLQSSVNSRRTEELIERQYNPLRHFIKTETKPHLFFKPAKDCEESTKKLQASQEALSLQISKLRKAGPEPETETKPDDSNGNVVETADQMETQEPANVVDTDMASTDQMDADAAATSELPIVS